MALAGVAFEARAGEILGIAGVAGNGQNELLEALSGERRTRADAIVLEGRPVGDLGPTERRAHGLGAVPEERNGHAAIGEFSLAENAALTARGRMKLEHCGLIDATAAALLADTIVGTFGVKAQGAAQSAGALSGGNLQKFVVGREILQKPRALIVGQPTWGVDAGAAATIHRALLDLAAEGAAIVVISQDLDELLALCDRIAVISVGRLSAPFARAEASLDEIGLLMGGVHGARGGARNSGAADALPA